jgi:hypothetical protein
MKRLHVLWYSLVVPTLVIAGLSCGTSAPPYQQLAMIDSGTQNPPVELVEEFRTALDSLSRKCPSQSPEEIRDEIVQGQKIFLKIMGKNFKLIKIAKVMDKTIPEDTVVEKCDKVNTSLL